MFTLASTIIGASLVVNMSGMATVVRDEGGVTVGWVHGHKATLSVPVGDLGAGTTIADRYIQIGPETYALYFLDTAKVTLGTSGEPDANWKDDPGACPSDLKWSYMQTLVDLKSVFGDSKVKAPGSYMRLMKRSGAGTLKTVKPLLAAKAWKLLDKDGNDVGAEADKNARAYADTIEYRTALLAAGKPEIEWKEDGKDRKIFAKGGGSDLVVTVSSLGQPYGTESKLEHFEHYHGALSGTYEKGYLGLSKFECKPGKDKPEAILATRELSGMSPKVAAAAAGALGRPIFCPPARATQ